MKKYILLFALIAAATTMATLVDKFKGWNELIERSPDIVIARCVAPPTAAQTKKATIIINGSVPSDIEVIAVLKGTTVPGSSRLLSSYRPRQGEQFLLFASYRNDTSFIGYNAVEEYRVVPLNHFFQTNMLAGKTLEQKIEWILQSRLRDLNEELERGQEEKQRLEEGIKTIKQPGAPSGSEIPTPAGP